MCSIFLCVLIPRFELLAACSEDWRLLRTPAALAPEPGRAQTVGQTSRAAEAYGIRPGMRLGEALSRCPELNLVPPDPARAVKLWDEIRERLVGIGAEVESERAGEAFFQTEGLHRLHGGRAGTVAATRRTLTQHRAIGAAARIATAPSPFAARLAAGLEEPVEAVEPDRVRDFLAPLPISALSSDESFDDSLIRDLERLGLNTLGALAALPVDAMADRFGKPGLRARFLAEGGAEPLRPSAPVEPLEESMELPDSRDGSQLPHALELLIDRFLALPDRRGRALRSLALSASLAGGGSWRIELALNQPSGSAEVLRLALAPKLEALPGPADSLTLRALEITAGDAEQTPLLSRLEEQRRGRLTEAVRQTRATAGADSLLRVLMLDPEARLPERRLTLSPFEAKRR